MANHTRNIFGFISRYLRMRDKANRIKEDEEKRHKSFHFGVTSCITSCIAIAFCILGAWFFKNFSDSGLEIFTIIIGIGFIACGVILFVWALIRLLLQFGINRNWSEWLAVLIFVIGIIGSLIFIVTSFNG